jgi:hypothetical protein
MSCIDIDHSWRHPNVAETCVDHQRIDLPTDEGVSAGASLKRHLALDGVACGDAIWMEVGGTVIAFDHCHGASRLQHSEKPTERPGRVAEMLEDEANEDVDRNEGSIWAALRQRDRLRADAAADLENPTATFVIRVVVQKFDQRIGLVL